MYFQSTVFINTLHCFHVPLVQPSPLPNVKGCGSVIASDSHLPKVSNATTWNEEKQFKIVKCKFSVQVQAAMVFFWTKSQVLKATLARS